MSKHWKPTCILSFIIHNNWIQFLKVVTLMVQVTKEQSFWDRLGCLFVFQVCGCICVDDGLTRWANNKDKKVGHQEAKHQFLLPQLLCFS
jgi:hypothetical protein